MATVSSGEVWAPNGPIEQQIELLRQRTTQLAHQAAERDAAMAAKLTDLGAHIDHAVNTAAVALQDLRHELDSREANLSEFDAAGVPLIALSIVMCGLPRLVPILDVLLLVVAGASAIPAIRHLRRHLLRGHDDV